MPHGHGRCHRRPSEKWVPSLSQNRLRVLATITNCEAFVVQAQTNAGLENMTLRLGAALEARQQPT